MNLFVAQRVSVLLGFLKKLNQGVMGVLFIAISIAVYIANAAPVG